MKFLIRLGVYAAPPVTLCILTALGFRLGALPVLLLYVPCTFLDRYWCAQIDLNRFVKEAKAKGYSTWDYAKIKFPPSLLMLCQSNRSNVAEFKRQLKQNIDADCITKSDANILLNIFGVARWL